MTIAQLIEKLKEFPPDLPVASFDVEYGVQLVENVVHVSGKESLLNGKEYIELQ